MLKLMTMAYTSRLLIFSFLLVCCMASTSSMATSEQLNSTSSTLMARLKLDVSEEGEEGSYKCWDSLFELQSCTGEVISFFLNGETYIGPACCHAIQIIEHECWPNLLGSFGFTSQESDILRGFCDASSPIEQPVNSTVP